MKMRSEGVCQFMMEMTVYPTQRKPPRPTVISLDTKSLTWGSPETRRRSGQKRAETSDCLRSSDEPAELSDRTTPEPGTAAPPPCWSGRGNPSNTWNHKEEVKSAVRTKTVPSDDFWMDSLVLADILHGWSPTFFRQRTGFVIFTDRFVRGWSWRPIF